MAITIELRDHVGITHTDLGPIQESLDQWMVLAKDEETMAGMPMFMGYLPKRDNAPFLPCIPFVEQPQVLRDAIVAALSKTVGRQVQCGVVPLLPQALDREEAEHEDEEDNGSDES